MTSLLISTNTLKQYGDDTEFTLDLKQSYTCSSIQLSRATINNLMSNFIGSKQQDFSYKVGTTTYQLTINQIHLSLAQFISYFNQRQSNVVLTLTDVSTTYSICTITGSVAWSPVGTGWTRLGYTVLSPAINTVQTAQTYFNLSQTPVIHIRFDNIPNGYKGSDGQCTFSIVNSSSFGSLLIWDSQEHLCNQKIYFQQPISFSSLSMVFLDQNFNKIETNNNNTAGMNIFMELLLDNE